MKIRRKEKTNSEDFDIRLCTREWYEYRRHTMSLYGTFLADISAETEKAVLINEVLWIPKNQIEYVGEDEKGYPTYIIPEWIFRKIE